MEIYLVRHTSVAINTGICYGQADVDLSKSFEEEVKTIKKSLNNIHFDSIHSSPLKRCAELAKVFNKNIIYDQRLMEINFGDWELQEWNNIKKSDLEKWGNDFINYSPPNGENLQELALRISFFINELREAKKEKILIISHAGPIRCFWHYLLGLPLENIFKIDIKYGAIHHFKLANDKTFDKLIATY